MIRTIELGPIRPPSEAQSLLLRVTRNCAWNQCRFCTIYKEQRFGTRPMEDIKADIDQIALYRNHILETGALQAPYGATLFGEQLRDLPEEVVQSYLQVLNWVGNGEESVFLQDADVMVLTFDKLREILLYLREKLPRIKRVTSYGRADSLAKFSVEQLVELKKAGLDRIHSGYETGSDQVLALIRKGYTKAQEIEVGRRVKAAGIEFSIYYMPGVGGEALSEDNALETADVVNQINPDFVRIRTFVPKQNTGLAEDIANHALHPCTDAEKALELKRMIANINSADGYLYSDHIINLFEDVKGNMKTDKEKMLSVFTAFEALDPHKQRMYQLARRMGMVRSLAQMDMLGKEQLENIDHYLAQLDTEEKFEAFLLSCLRRYI